MDSDIFDQSGPDVLPENVPAHLRRELGDIYRPQLVDQKANQNYVIATMLITPFVAVAALLIAGLYTQYFGFGIASVIFALAAAVFFYRQQVYEQKPAYIAIAALATLFVLFVVEYTQTISTLDLYTPPVLIVVSTIIVFMADRLSNFAVNWALASPRFESKTKTLIKKRWAERWSLTAEKREINKSFQYYPYKAAWMAFNLFVGIGWLMFQRDTVIIYFSVIPMGVILGVYFLSAWKKKDEILDEHPEGLFTDIQKTDWKPGLELIKEIGVAFFRHSVSGRYGSFRQQPKAIGEVQRNITSGTSLYFIYCIVFFLGALPALYNQLKESNFVFYDFVFGAALLAIVPAITIISVTAILSLPFVALLWRDAEADKAKTRWKDHEQLTRSGSEELRDNIFIGTHKRGPVFLNRNALAAHGYIGGAPNSGKTSLGLAPLARSLIEREDCPVVIIDMKGGRDLFQAIRDISGQRFRYFTINSKLHTYCFDPMRAIKINELAPWEVTDTLLDSLELAYGSGYGRSHFSAEIRNVLRNGLNDLKDKKDVYGFEDILKALPKGKPEQRSAADLYNILKDAASLPHLNSSSAEQSPELDEAWKHAIDLEQSLRRNHVLYFHLPTQGKTTATMVGTTVLHSLYAVLTRLQNDQKKQAFVFIDEYQELASEFDTSLFQKVRSCGMALIAVTQDLQALERHDRLNRQIPGLVTFEQHFSMSNEETIKRMVDDSGTDLQRPYIAYQLGEDGEPLDAFEVHLQRAGKKYIKKVFGNPKYEKVKRVTRDDITQIGKAKRWSLIKIRDGDEVDAEEGNEGQAGLSQTSGRPMPVRGYFAWTKDEWDRLERLPWPKHPGTIVSGEHLDSVLQAKRSEEPPRVLLKSDLDFIESGLLPESLDLENSEVAQHLKNSIPKRAKTDAEKLNNLASTKRAGEPEI